MHYGIREGYITTINVHAQRGLPGNHGFEAVRWKVIKRWAKKAEGLSFMPATPGFKQAVVLTKKA